MKHVLISALIITLLSCSKKNESSLNPQQMKPLKAIMTYTVNGRSILLSADKSEGVVCAYGWAMAIGSPEKARVTFTPFSAWVIEGERQTDGTSYYVNKQCEYKPVTATVTESGRYVFSLAVYDKDKKESWLYQNIDVP